MLSVFVCCVRFCTFYLFFLFLFSFFLFFFHSSSVASVSVLSFAIHLVAVRIMPIATMCKCRAVQRPREKAHKEEYNANLDSNTILY